MAGYRGDFATEEEYNAYRANAAAVQRANANRGLDSTGNPTGWRGDSAGLSSDQASARAVIRSTLDEYGLGTLADRAWNWYLSGIPMEQIMLDIRKSPEYQQRFPGMAELGKKGHAITETDYINLEREYTSRMREAGLPVGFYDGAEDFAAFIGGEVSPSELQGRLDEYKTITYSLPPIVRNELGRQFGLTDGDITAYIMDPNRALPILHNQLLAAQTGAAARQSGFGPLTVSEAQGLSQFGIDFNTALSGFGQLTQSKQLFQPLAGDAGETGISREEQLGAAFGGDAGAQQRIKNRARKRQATYQEGGSYAGGSGFGSTT